MKGAFVFECRKIITHRQGAIPGRGTMFDRNNHQKKETSAGSRQKKERKPGFRLALAGFILGLAAYAVIPLGDLLVLICGGLGLIFSLVASRNKKYNYKGKLAMAGMILSLIAVILFAAAYILYLVLLFI